MLATLPFQTLLLLLLSRFSRVRLLATPWTVAHQGPPSMGFSRQEYWSGVPSSFFEYFFVSLAALDAPASTYIYLTPALESGEGTGTPLQYSSWKIPWMEDPGRLQSMGSLRVGHDWATSLSLFTFMHWRRKWQPTPVFLPGESQGRESLVGCHLWGRTESDTTEAT